MDLSYFFVFCVVPILILNYLSLRPQRRFIERYKKKVNQDDFLYPSEYAARYRNRPLEQIRDAPHMLLSRVELFWKDYRDPELNTAAHELRLYFLAEFLVLLIFFIVVAFFVLK